MGIAKQNEIKEMYEKNLQLLNPWMRETAMKIDENELWKKIEVTYNDEGYPVCRYRQDDTVFRIVSEQPLPEAQKWCKTVLKQASGAIFLFGSGFGYPLFELFAHKMSHTLVVVFEEDLFLFKAMLYYFDLEPLFKSGKLILLVGDSQYFSLAFFELFYSINFFSCTCPVFSFTPAAQRNFKERYIQIYRFVLSQMAYLTFYIGNDHLDTMIGLCNLIANAGAVVRNPFISCLKDKYKDTPAFIVANGPSLDKNIGQLKKIDGKGLIISVESAIVPLIKNGIKPDILTIIERSEKTFTYHLENRNFPDDMALICLAMVDKQVFPSFKGAKIPIFRKGEAINEWVNQSLGDGSAIDAGANVSHLAAELAAYLGANPIVFVGQDYAYGTEGATHSRDAAYYEQTGKATRSFVESLPVVYVEGNDGYPIPTNFIWKDFKLGLEMKIMTHPEKLFLNATEGGAKINGTETIPLAEAIQKYCTEQIPYRVNSIIDENSQNISMPQRTERLKKLIESAKEQAILFRGYVQDTVRGKLDCKRMVNLSQSEDANHEVLDEIHRKNLQVFDAFIRNGLCRHFTQQWFFVYYYLLNRLGAIDTPEKVTENFKIQYNTFQYLNIVNQSLGIHLENAVESLQDQLRDLENEMKGCDAHESN